MSKDEVCDLIKDILETERVRLGLRTDQQLAHHLGTSPTMLWRWRNGYLPPSILILLPLLHRQTHPESTDVAA